MMQYFKNKSYWNNYLHKALLLLIILLNVSNLFGSKPNIKISSSAVSPRLSLIDTDEQTHWRTLLSYDQDFGKNISVDAFIEYGSENNHFRNPFRVHHLTADLKLKNHQLSIGRIAIWNALQNARVDGAQLNINTKKSGTVSLIGGFKAIINFSDYLFTDNTYFMASWSKGRIGKNLALSFWMNGGVDGINPFTGVQFNTSKFGIRFSNALAIDIGEGKLDYARIRASKRFGDHTIGLGFRQKRFNAYKYYEDFLNKDEIHISPTLTVDVNSLLSQQLLLRNQLAYRIGEEGKAFLISSVNFKKIAASLLAGLEGDNLMYGLVLGASHRLGGPLSFGGSVSYNALDYGDFADLQKSMGAYGWIGWQPKDYLMVKLFGRFSNNPYFKQDGRGGVIINVVF
jgi:hypothetical protein